MEPEGYYAQQVTLSGRKGGKTSAMRKAVREAAEQGEHVHVASAEGMFCAALEQPGNCHLPKWEDDGPSA